MASLRSLSALRSRSSLSTLDCFAATASRASAARLMPPPPPPPAASRASLSLQPPSARFPVAAACRGDGWGTGAQRRADIRKNVDQLGDILRHSVASCSRAICACSPFPLSRLALRWALQGLACRLSASTIRSYMCGLQYSTCSQVPPEVLSALSRAPRGGGGAAVADAVRL